ncbi:hypothetical protein QQY66_21890 [Streptomyces sp. DG2A-72]|uniref:hypothetical protein n=1 Tax=Streptomyces sp. DG2A-72 TaxID=3051386 RepID=UPI00265C18F5|nr:hypothetical protein [Streptomyces sp. DG2A-72]MDO0934213.1 hypothetical protein [Streptomyces sp. DG2A-72]
MISQAHTLHATMHFAVLDAPSMLAHPDASLDVVLLFAVLTCIPGDDIHSDGQLTTHKHRQSHPCENHWCPACSVDGLTSYRESAA